MGQRLGPAGATGADGRATWLRSPCLGQCERAPAALLTIAGEEPRAVAVAPADAAALADRLGAAAAGRDAGRDAGDAPWGPERQAAIRASVSQAGSDGPAPGASVRPCPPAAPTRGSRRAARDPRVVARIRTRVRPAAAASRRPPSPAASTGATATAWGVSPATVRKAAGARSHWPRQGLRNQVARPSARGARRAEPSVPARRRAPPPRPGGRRCRRRHGPPPAVAPWLPAGSRSGHAVGLGRWDRQAATDVAQRGLADVADAVLQGMQRRQQLVAMARAAWPPRATWPSMGRVAQAACQAVAGRQFAEDRIHGGALGGAGRRRDHVRSTARV